MPAIPRDVDSGTPEAGTSGTPAPDDHKHVLANLGVATAKIANLAVTNAKIANATIDLTTKATYVPVNKAGDTMSGSLGIGIASPRERLEVTGGIRLGQAPTTFTTLSAAMNATQTTATVVSTSGYNARGTLLIDSEAMTYTGTTATSFTGLTRGALGTTAATHSSGATVKNYLLTAIATSTTPRMVITGDGSVGIGTTRPGGTVGSYGTHTKLDIVSSSTQGWLRLASGVTGEDVAGVWLHPYDFANAGWIMGTNNDGKLRLGYGSGADEGSAVTNAKDGLSGITIETDGTVKVGTKLKLLNEGREIIGTHDATSMKVDINPVMRTEGMIKVQVGGAPGNPINVPADYCRGIEVGGYVTGETFDAIHVSLETWQNDPNEVGCFIGGLTSHGSAGITMQHQRAIIASDAPSGGRATGIDSELQIYNSPPSDYNFCYLARSTGDQPVRTAFKAWPAGREGGPNPGFVNVLDCTGVPLQSAAIVLSENMAIQFQGMDVPWPQRATVIKYRSAGSAPNVTTDRLEFIIHNTVYGYLDSTGFHNANYSG